MMKKVLLLLALLGPAALGNVTECGTESEAMFENPLGTCACDGHLWLGANCQEAYYCLDRDGSGCYKSCPDGQFVSPEFSNDSWSCLEPGTGTDKDYEDHKVNVCPFPLGTDICTGDAYTPAPTPDGPITSNPLGECRCNGELWVSEGCSYGFYCDDTKPEGGRYLACLDGESLSIDITVDPPTWNCTTDTATCPGGSVDGIGCPMSECTYSLNPLGECGCDGQFFINDDCTQGFLCDSNIPNPYIYDGCVQTCFPDEMLVPNFSDDSWECVPRASAYTCPGHFNLQCEDEPLGEGGFTEADCECSGQLLISEDCSTGFYCLERLPNGGQILECPEGQIVVPDLIDYSFVCVDDEGQCPGLGGFKVGCDTDSIPVKPIECNTGAPNPLGTCDGCEGQIFVNDDCKSAFICSNLVEGDGNEGCLMECPEGERVHVDLTNREWGCVIETEEFLCPGFLKVDCDPNFNVKCSCHNEFWMSPDCTQGFWCSGAQDALGVNPGQSLSCPEGSYLNVDFEEFKYSCTSDESQCPGSFHFGCDGGDFQELDCTYSNPFGQCECDGQMFIDSDCNSGFYCDSTISDNLIFDGCYKKCPDNQILVPRFGQEIWECVSPPADNFYCPGKFNLECPDGNVGGSFDSSICECDGQFWVSDDCKESFFCLHRQPGGGVSQTCGDGEIISVDFDQFTYGCQPDEGQCPGLGGFHMGCQDGAPTPPPLNCDWAPNPLGTCGGCEGQIFIDEDCSQAFYCSEYVEGDGNDGCLKSCGPDERIEVDLTTMEWNCIPRDEDFKCPGAFEVDCYPSFKVDCECKDQYWVNRDCTFGFRCAGPEDPETGLQQGQILSCPPGQYLDIDFHDPVYRCTSETNQCPGSFHFGCEGGDFGQPTTTVDPDLTTDGGNETPAPETTTEPLPPLEGCNAALNTLGQCSGCNDQYFVADDCRSSFLCTSQSGDSNADGCELSCSSSQRVELDFDKQIWECVDREEDFFCPGDFNTDCDSGFNVRCECKNEVWISEDCSQAFLCSDTMTQGTNPGDFLACPDNQVFEVGLLGDLTLQCVSDQGQCPGSYHYGCEGGDFGQLPDEMTTAAAATTQGPAETTTAPDAGTTTTTGGAAGVMVELGCVLLASVFGMLFL